MGKRELLLVCAFVVLGAIVYKATARAPREGERRFSWSQLSQTVHRAVRGNRASADITSTFAHPVPATVNTLRLSAVPGDMVVVGEDRDDIVAELKVWSNGYDEAEAQKLAKEVFMKYDDGGAVVTAEVKFPAGGTQRASMSLRVPARLELRMATQGVPLDVRNLAAVDIAMSRSATTIRNVAGRVTIVHRGAELTIEDIGSLRLTTASGAEVTATKIRGETNLSLSGGEFHGRDIVGPIDIQASATDVVLEGLDHVSGMTRINATNGSVRIDGLRTEARVDGRSTDTTVAIAKPATVALYNDGNGDIEVTLPSDGGFRLDVAADGGRIDAVGGLPEVKGTEQQQRLTGDVRGGGPTITLRVASGDIKLKTKNDEKK
jgi:hypothetical protein